MKRLLSPLLTFGDGLFIGLIGWGRHVLGRALAACAAALDLLAIKYQVLYSPGWIERITWRRGAMTERLFWQSGGGYDRNLTEPKTPLQVIEYVHLNPVRRGLVEQARDWYWSSAAWYEGVGDSPLVPDAIPTEWLSG